MGFLLSKTIKTAVSKTALRTGAHALGLATALLTSACPMQLLHAAEDARVLPQGRFRLSYGYARSGDISSKFNSQGRVESLLAPYQLELNSTNLRTFDDNLSTLINLLNSTGLRFDSSRKDELSQGLSMDPGKPLIGDALERGALSIDGEGVRTQQMLSLQYGLTDRIAVGFLVPIVSTQVSIRAGIQGTNTAKDIYQSFIASDPNLLGSFNEVPLALSLIGDSDTDTLQELLEARGYDRVESTDETGVGDIGVGGRWNWWKDPGRASGDWMGSLQLSATAPTGRLSLPSEITRFDIGQGTWEVQAAQVFNYTPWRLLTLTASAHYSYRLPSSRLKRVRDSTEDLIPDASTEELVDMRLGDKLWGVLGARLQLTRALSVDCGYEAYWKGQDIYQGSRDKDYTYLSNDTASYTETLQVGAAFSTIPAFFASSFPIPLDASVNYYWVPRGTNTLQTSFATAELAMYF
jgi:hypothetical protein